METAYRSHERHPWVMAFLDAVGLEESSVATDVAARDEMFRYLLDQRHGHRDRALVDYFRTGHAAASVLAGLAESVLGVEPSPPSPLSQRERGLTEPNQQHPPPSPSGRGGTEGGEGPSRQHPPRILDFAAGWGRVTRFLVSLLPEAEWWVSDISQGSVEFQRETFGVRGFPSAARPEDLDAPGRFDVVLVSSLFTHLPRETFGRWLRRLWELVDDDGVLIFSTHDVSTLPEGEEPEPDGFRFLERSEIDSLSKRDYGETWVSEDFVAARISELSPEPTAGSRLPRGLWHFQDLYVLGRGREGAALELDPGPRGHVEAATLEHGERLWLEGWADEGELEITVNGRSTAVLETAERTGPERGWIAKVEPSDGEFLRPTDLLRVRLTSPTGQRRVLHVSTLEDLLAELREADLRCELATTQYELDRADRYLKGNAHVIYGLEHRVSAMEASRFWKLREIWFRIKRRLGLPSE